MTRNQVLALPNWRGVSGIKMKSNGAYSDPWLIYQGRVFNYWDIEDALWDMFLEETGHDDSEAESPAVEAEFSEYLKETAKDYLDDCLFGGYPAKRFEEV